MDYNSNALNIYTDGSCLGNPGPGGIGGVAEFPEIFKREKEIIFKEGYFETTNNRMELRACIKALEYLQKNSRILKTQRAVIITDSLYIIENKCRLINWRKNKWKGKERFSIGNIDLWKKFLSVKGQIRISNDIQYCKGKSTSVTQEVDRLAKRAAKNPTRKDIGFQPGKIGRSLMSGKGVSTLFPARNQTITIRVYRKKLHTKKESKIFFDLFDKTSKKYTAKHHAYTPLDKSSRLNRGCCYNVSLNDNPKYPIIKTLRKLKNCPHKKEKVPKVRNRH